MTTFVINGICRSEGYMREVAQSAGIGGWWGRQADHAKTVVDSLDEHRALKRLAKSQGFDADELFIWFGMEKAKALMSGETVEEIITASGAFWLCMNPHVRQIASEEDVSLLESDQKPFKVFFDMRSPILARCRLSYTKG